MAPAQYEVSCFEDSSPAGSYTLSLHDALPISAERVALLDADGNGYLEPKETSQLTRFERGLFDALDADGDGDRKSTRLNSSHRTISYAASCLKKKNHLVTKGQGSVCALHTHAQ